MGERITFAIGDIHGCFDKLKALFDVCDASVADNESRFVLLGDYVDRGPDSAGVISFLRAQQTQRGDRFVCLRGNHEEMLLRAANPDRWDNDLMTWWANGGEATLASYGIDDPCDMPAEDLAWMRTLTMHLQDRHRLFIHAGIRPGIALSDQTDEDMMWIREPFLSSHYDHGMLVVHGHSPTRARPPELRSNRLNLDTGACLGGPLTAAAFSHDRREPLFFLTDSGARMEVIRQSRAPSSR